MRLDATLGALPLEKRAAEPGNLMADDEVRVCAYTNTRGRLDGTQGWVKNAARTT